MSIDWSKRTPEVKVVVYRWCGCRHHKREHWHSHYEHSVHGTCTVVGGCIVEGCECKLFSAQL